MTLVVVANSKALYYILDFAGCDNTRFLVVPDWYSKFPNNYCRILASWYKFKTQGVLNF